MRIFVKGFALLLLATTLSVLITFSFIRLGIDWKWAEFFSRNDIYVYLSVPGVLSGMVVPLILILVYYFRIKSNEERLFFNRLFFTFLLSFLFSTLLKGFTNRIDMEPFEPLGSIDISNGFRFGFMNSNSWWESFSEGWPSGHTLVTLAMAVIIHPSLSSKKLRYLNIGYTIYVSLAVSTAFHWLSDVASGAVLGWGIAFSVNSGKTP